ncbi:MAG: hypothetical protein R2688_08030 [Fimbriimonadaceae bacterium]
MERRNLFIRIVGFSILASVVYGIAHDMITAHYCPAYFLPHITSLSTQKSPLSRPDMGCCGDVLDGSTRGQWWGLARVAGRLPLLPFPRFKKMLIRCLLITFILAMVAMIGVHLIGDIAKAQSTSVIEEDRRLVVAAVTHGVSYFASATSGIFLCIWAVVVRSKNEEGLESDIIDCNGAAHLYDSSCNPLARNRLSWSHAPLALQAKSKEAPSISSKSVI